jgi:signal transduction protein with GAF and PtsI domain
MENNNVDTLLERLIEDAKKYTSGAEAALDHINMGFVHLYRHLNGNDRHNLLSDLEEFNSRLKNFLVDEGNNV